MVKEVVSFLHEQLRYHGIAVTLGLVEPDPIVLTSAIQLEHGLINLMANPRDATAPDTAFRILISPVGIDPSPRPSGGLTPWRSSPTLGSQQT